MNEKLTEKERKKLFGNGLRMDAFIYIREKEKQSVFYGSKVRIVKYDPKIQLLEILVDKQRFVTQGSVLDSMIRVRKFFFWRIKELHFIVEVRS